MDTLHKKWSFPWGNSSENVGPNPQETADLVTFTEEILNGKHFCAVKFGLHIKLWTGGYGT